MVWAASSSRSSASRPLMCSLLPSNSFKFMKNLFVEIRSSVMVTLIFAVVCCGIYPLAVYGISQILFRDQANGSLIVGKDGTIHGSRLLGQQFTQDKYFIT